MKILGKDALFDYKGVMLRREIGFLPFCNILILNK